MNVIERYESAAQSYVRAAPVVFRQARGAELFDDKGSLFIDFYSGGGTLNYGHNHLSVCTALIDYLCQDGIVQTRDKSSVAKREFIRSFVQTILEPRNLNYKLLFTDPGSGTATEIALRLARRDRKRSNVLAFTNGSHGLTAGAATVTSRMALKHESVDLRSHTVFMPYCGYFGPDTDTIPYLRRYLEDTASGVERPAAVIVATVQDEGGVHVATNAWLKSLEGLCREFDILLILDETQTGCGRCGSFFSFERSGIVPDMVLVSHAIAGGLPMSLLLMKPELDHWRPGEQVGIFQGDSLAFVAATELLKLWNDDTLAADIAVRGQMLESALTAMLAKFPPQRAALRGDGMLWGLDFGAAASAAVISGWALEAGLVVETARLRDEVLLIQPPVTISDDTMREGLRRLDVAVSMFLSHH